MLRNKTPKRKKSSSSNPKNNKVSINMGKKENQRKAFMQK